MITRLLVRLIVFLIAGALSITSLTGETIAYIKVETGPFVRYGSNLFLEISSITDIVESELILYEIRKGERYPVAIQFSYQDGKKKIHWQLGNYIDAYATLTYELAKGMAPFSPKYYHISWVDGNYIFRRGNRAVLQYNATMVYPPKGEDESLKRDGFIHPLYAPDGTILTAIQPADHMHHYGIWNPWTKTTFRDEEVDFWNLRKMQGTVRHVGIDNLDEGPVFASAEVKHYHVAWPESTKQTVAMEEKQVIRVYHSTENTYMVEFDILLTPHEAITLEQYRYGGFVFRGTPNWNNKTASFFTSEGLDRDRADGEPARWCVVSGKANKGTAGILFMSHPQNYNHPEPLRVWPSDAADGAGYFMINFSPTRNTSWQLEKGQIYRLQYRLMVFSGSPDSFSFDSYWNDWAYPPIVSWEKRD
jgi:hypothetical protein